MSILLTEQEVESVYKTLLESNGVITTQSASRAICIAQIEKLRKEPVAGYAITTSDGMKMLMRTRIEQSGYTSKPLHHTPSPQELALEVLADTSHALGGYEQEES